MESTNMSEHSTEQRISKFDAMLLAVGLEMSLIQIKITEGCAKLSAAAKGEVENENTVQRRAKRIRDREFIEEVLKATIVELIELGDYLELRHSVDFLTHDSIKLENLIIEHDHLKSSRISMVKEIKSKRKQQHQALRTASGRITDLKDRIENERRNTAMRLAYADKCLNAGLEVLELKLARPLAVLPREDHEHRVHTELNKAYELQIQEREKAVEFWRLAYGEDTADINERLANVREQLKVATARRVELQQLYDLHAGEMRAWLTFKEQRAARLALEALRQRSATTIQAWWRGVMVRRGLGHFKIVRNTARKSPAKNKKK